MSPTPILVTPRMEKLNASHAVAAFESSSPPLNVFLRRHALQSQGANAAQTYVAAVGDHVVSVV